MSNYHKKPGSPGDVLKHYGVKGMRWGVRREDDTGGDQPGGKVGPKDAASKNASTKAFMAASKELDREASKLSSAQVGKNLDEAQAKFDAKFSDGKFTSASSAKKAKKADESLKDKWDNLRPDQKSAIIKVGVGVALAGGLAYAGHRNKAAILGMAGKPISNSDFNSNVFTSQMRVWGSGNYCKGDAFKRPAFELPAGHEFYRLTTSAETGFRDATYSTHSMEDAKRYVANFRKEKGPVDMNFVRFTTNAPTKVPDLNTVLSSLKEHMTETHSSSASPRDKDVLKMYNKMSGGSWDSPEAKGLISKLKSKGYGALVDEMDAGVIGESPIVFFNQENANPKQIAPLTDKLIHAAESGLIEIPNRKL